MAKTTLMMIGWRTNGYILPRARPYKGTFEHSGEKSNIRNQINYASSRASSLSQANATSVIMHLIMQAILESI